MIEEDLELLRLLEILAHREIEKPDCVPSQHSASPFIEKMDHIGCFYKMHLHSYNRLHYFTNLTLDKIRHSGVTTFQNI